MSGVPTESHDGGSPDSSHGHDHHHGHHHDHHSGLHIHVHEDGEMYMGSGDDEDWNSGGLEVVCYNERYYIREHDEGAYDFLGAHIVRGIPKKPSLYKRWLARTRAEYAALEQKLESLVFTLNNDGVRTIPGMVTKKDFFKNYLELPTALPYFNCLPKFQDDGVYQSVFPANQHIYIVDLDAEALTIDYSVHYRLNSIPRQSDFHHWIDDMCSSQYGFSPTVERVCSARHLTSLAIDLPEPDMAVGTSMVQQCIPHVSLADEDHRCLFALWAASMFGNYRDTIAALGRQWKPTSFAFREFVYAVITCAAGNFAICPASKVSRNGQFIRLQASRHDQEHATDSGPILQFGSMAHLPDTPPGAAPVETTYWMPGSFSEALVSLALVVDGKAVTEAMKWGVESKVKAGENGGCFFMVVISLFEVILAEVNWTKTTVNSPRVRMSPSIPLSPITPGDCLSSHPYDRPRYDFKKHMAFHRGEGPDENLKPYMPWVRYPMDYEEIQESFPGCAVLANFFNALTRRRDIAAISASCGPFGDGSVGTRRGRLPNELYPMIIDHLDHKTWKACLTVSRDFHTMCMKRYRLDDTNVLDCAGGCFYNPLDGFGSMAFFVENVSTQSSYEATQGRGGQFDQYGTGDFEWIVLIGEGQRRVALLTMPQTKTEILKTDLVDEEGIANDMVWPTLTM